MGKLTTFHRPAVLSTHCPTNASKGWMRQPPRLPALSPTPRVGHPNGVQRCSAFTFCSDRMRPQNKWPNQHSLTRTTNPGRRGRFSDPSPQMTLGSTSPPSASPRWIVSIRLTVKMPPRCVSQPYAALCGMPPIFCTRHRRGFLRLSNF